MKELIDIFYEKALEALNKRVETLNSEILANPRVGRDIVNRIESEKSGVQEAIIVLEGVKFNFKQEESKKTETLKVVPFQRCPICEGQGVVPFFGTTSSLTSNTCTVCNGAKVIPMCVVK